MFVRIARTVEQPLAGKDLLELAADVRAQAANEVVGLLPRQVHLCVDRITGEALHMPLRVVLPTLLWAWLSPHGPKLLEAWASLGRKLGKQTSARMLFLSAVLNRADLLRAIVQTGLVDGNAAMFNAEVDLYLADLVRAPPEAACAWPDTRQDPVAWRLGLMALFTGGVVNILAALSALASPPDQYEEPMPPPLLAAAALGNYEAVVTLIDLRADPNAAYAGLTALHLAARFGYGDIAKLLIFAGAAPDARNAANQTPLQLAQSADVAVIIRAAVAAKRKVDQGATSGAPALSVGTTPSPAPVSPRMPMSKRPRSPRGSRRSLASSSPIESTPLVSALDE
jgi:hypothetical protein